MSTRVLLVFALVFAVAIAETRFEVCTFRDSKCSEDKSCETETTGDCADVDVEGIDKGDVGVKVICNLTSGSHTVQYFPSDDCRGTITATGSVPNKQCVLSDKGVFSNVYITVDCYESAVCFDRNSQVLTESGDYKSLADVKVGDRVQSVDRLGRSIFSEVFLTQHKSTASETSMLDIVVGDNAQSLKVTRDHYLRVPPFTSESYMKASRLSVGDALYTMVSGQTKETTITSIRQVSAVPRNVHTMNDRIVVDGVVASCVSSNDVLGLDTMQIRGLLTPLKLMHKMGLRGTVSLIDDALHTIYKKLEKH